jgi:hypothetical protein
MHERVLIKDSGYQNYDAIIVFHDVFTFISGIYTSLEKIKDDLNLNISSFQILYKLKMEK